MFSSLTRCAAACLLLATASAQTIGPRVGRVRTPVVDGGTLHLATGVWSRGAGLPGQTVFNNDAAQPFFLSLKRGEQVADFGRIPASTPSAPSVGTEQGQRMNGFQFAYSTREVRGQFGYVVTFYDNFGFGDSPDGRAIAARIQLVDLPGAPKHGVQANWKVAVNLRHSPYEFILGQDAEGGHADARFGWSLSRMGDLHGPGGPILAGDPLGDFGPAAGSGAGTNWNGDVGAPGTGLGTEDAFWRHGRGPDGVEKATVDDIPNAPISYGSFHLQLYANGDQALTGSTNIGTNYCTGNSTPILFHGGFESNDFSTEGWEVVGAAAIHRPSPVGVPDFEGELVARLYHGTSVAKTVSTVGYGVIGVRYVCQVGSLPNQSYLWIDWWDGTNWHVIDQVHQSPWAQRFFDLPNAALNNPEFKIRFRNDGPPTDSGAVFIDDIIIEGRGVGHIEAFGSTSIADNNIILVASGVPPDSFGMFYFGSQEVYTPLGVGFRCVGGSGQQRLLPLLQADETGGVSRNLDFASEPINSTFMSSGPVTGNFQYWHRDHGSSNLTDALRLHLEE